ncbi:hypothetical protein PAPYR_442 [Paratrimastix pyriformis]|uniref:RRM domain-containing protein n=1 Tax=Paratrimastix pyriformis TaxID=342808 RepID=A0ABQ8V008_9EUKA|nr:hypothetical protein PAPYR_442 [Paratrimastix pyriformis]
MATSDFRSFLPVMAPQQAGHRPLEPALDRRRLFVGGIAWETTDAGFKTAFGKFGVILAARICKDKFSGRSRGIGFVRYREESSAAMAITEMHDKMLDGRRIRVQYAQQERGPALLSTPHNLGATPAPPPLPSPAPSPVISPFPPSLPSPSPSLIPSPLPSLLASSNSSPILARPLLPRGGSYPFVGSVPSRGPGVLGLVGLPGLEQPRQFPVGPGQLPQYIMMPSYTAQGSLLQVLVPCPGAYMPPSRGRLTDGGDSSFAASYPGPGPTLDHPRR